MLVCAATLAALLSAAAGDDTVGVFQSELQTEAVVSHVLHDPQREKDENRDGDIVRSQFPRCALACVAAMFRDGWCNSECYNEDCNWDAPDCENWCNAECKPEWIGDGVCDKACYTAACSFDKGDCGAQSATLGAAHAFAPSEIFDFARCPCEQFKLENGHCDFECDLPECNFDNGQCAGLCAKDCWYNWVGDGECDRKCFVAECGWDKGDCEECAPGCRPDLIGNGICDKVCMKKSCHWDMGDCANICAVQPVDYAAQPFEYHACRKEWVGDGKCDCDCNNKECNFDGGDCAGAEDPCGTGAAAAAEAAEAPRSTPFSGEANDK